MSTRHPSISGREIFSSGIVLAEQGQEIHLYPFPDESIWFLFRVKIVDEGSRTIIDPDQGDFTVIECQRSWNSGLLTANINQGELGEDGSYNYYFNYSLDLLGEREKFAYALVYNFLRDPKP